MTKEQALHQFWNGFGIPAYDENTVPSGATYPYITYNMQVDRIDHVVNLTASVWDRSTSWQKVTAVADNVAKELNDYECVKLDTGRLYLSQGTPFCQRMSDDTDDMIKRLYLIVQGEFLTAY